MQQAIEFPTDSPINFPSLTSQNGKLYQALQRGERINRFNAFEKYGIGSLHSRVSDLSNKFGINIKSEFININGISCCEYWI